MRVFKRDKFQCQRCSTFYGEDGNLLQAHHIVPRPHGKTNMDNLVTLCTSCHDYVELNGIDKLINQPNIKEHNGIRWQQWVYGSYRKPDKAER